VADAVGQRLSGWRAKARCCGDHSPQVAPGRAIGGQQAGGAISCARRRVLTDKPREKRRRMLAARDHRSGARGGAGANACLRRDDMPRELRQGVATVCPSDPDITRAAKQMDSAIGREPQTMTATTRRPYRAIGFGSALFARGACRSDRYRPANSSSAQSRISRWRRLSRARLGRKLRLMPNQWPLRRVREVRLYTNRSSPRTSTLLSSAYGWFGKEFMGGVARPHEQCSRLPFPQGGGVGWVYSPSVRADSGGAASRSCRRRKRVHLTPTSLPEGERVLVDAFELSNLTEASLDA